MKKTMSQVEKVNDMKIEIQKLLGEINKDMSKLKSEVASLHNILENDASLPMNAKMVNERLMVAAKEAGIDLSNLQVETSEENESERDDSRQESVSDNEQIASTSNVASLAAATDQLTKTVKRTLK